MKKSTALEKKKKSFIAVLILGILIITAGVIAYLILDNNLALAFGLGFGLSVGIMALTGIISINRNPEHFKELEIEENDERLKRIRERSAYNTFFVTLVSFVILSFIFILQTDLFAALLTVILLIIHVCTLLLFTAYYSKKM